MWLTTKTQYAVRALFDMAFHSVGQATQAKEIADRERIPLRYLEQILQDLRRGGIVEAKRGPRGGYALARPAAQIHIGEVLRAVRGTRDELFSLDGDAVSPVRRGTRRTRTISPAHGVDIPELVWRDLSTRLVEVLNSVTLQDFVKRAEAAGLQRSGQQPQMMYFI
ncbi:MAG TPA: Rrf2 family transcriptional regulator [Polyangia bacterium]|jgi:Rrf2 family protein|nr:Rrf2 family transcriptional regulator [Polyangia bacterium]